MNETGAEMDIGTFGVVGAGQMGSGIVQVAAASGLRVILNDIREDLVDKGIAAVAGRLERAVGKGRMAAEDRDNLLGRIRRSMSVEDMSEAHFVVEAATENEDVKFSIFRSLDRNCRPGVILASNTSSIPIGRIASQTKRPDKVIGMHFMNPVPVMKLVEVVRSLNTSEETFRTTWDLCIRFGKTPAEAADYPGFLANRILMSMINEAAYCLYQGVGSRESIDTVMKLGMNHPMGPLALADMIGLDTCLAIMDTLHDGFKDPKYRPCPLLRRYVEAGLLGRKAGRGFYEYE